MAGRKIHTEQTAGDRALSAAEQIAAMQRDGKTLDTNALFNVAMNNTSADTQDILHHLKNGLVDDKVDLQGLLRTAGHHMDGHGVAGDLLSQLGHVDLKGVNAAEMAKVPGMVVDKDTGDVNLLGLIPVPPQYAKLLTATYSYLLTHINGQVGAHAYDAGLLLGDKIGLSNLAKGRMGWAAAYGAMGLATFWADANQVIQGEKDYTKESAKLANQLAPVLQQIKGKQGVAALFGVGQGENEVIYNARRKMQRTQYAQRQRIATQALGRSAAFFASLGTLREHVDGKATQVAAQDVAEKTGVAGSFAAGHEAAQMEAAKVLEKQGKAVGGEGYQDALNAMTDRVMAHNSRSADFASRAQDLKRQADHGFGIFSNPEQMKAFGVVIAGQIAEGVADKWYGQRLKDIPQVSALDMILELRKQLDENPRSDRFKLPKGMRVEGGKGYDAQNLPLADYIAQIFEQHERDCSGKDGDIPERLDEDLMKACKHIAKELKDGHLDGLALIRLVGERKVVREGGRAVVPEDQVQHAVDDLKMTMRHVEWVDPKKYAADANFTLKDVKASWAAAAPDEKQMLVALIPDQVLSAAGIATDEVQQFRAHNINDYNTQIADITKALSAKGAAFLQDKGGLTHQEAEMIAGVGKQVGEHGASAIESALPGHGNKRDITRPLANAVMALSHEGKLNETLGRGVQA